MVDASHCPDTKVAGYGVWVASQRGKRAFDGAFKTTIDNATIAEMAAITNALYMGIKSGLIVSWDEVLVQTDCIAAILAFTGARNPAHSEERKIIDKQKELIVLYDITVRFKHVKGHSDNPGNRYVSNNICDRKAKTNMRNARQRFKLNQIKDKLKDSK